MAPLQEQIPMAMRLIRRPTRDEREESYAELRTEDGRVVAKVELMPVDTVH